MISRNNQRVKFVIHIHYRSNTNEELLKLKGEKEWLRTEITMRSR